MTQFDDVRRQGRQVIVGDVQVDQVDQRRRNLKYWLGGFMRVERERNCFLFVLDEIENES